MRFGEDETGGNVLRYEQCILNLKKVSYYAYIIPFIVLKYTTQWL